MAQREPRLKFSLQAEIAKLAPEEQGQVLDRLATLRDQLRQFPDYGDDIHDGSRMAWAFATDAEGTLDVEDIAHEMVSVHYLHCQTDYPQWVQERLRAAADVLHEAYPDLYWDKLWKLVVRFGVPIVKYASALQLMGGEEEVVVEEQGDGSCCRHVEEEPPTTTPGDDVLMAECDGGGDPIE